MSGLIVANHVAIRAQVGCFSKNFQSFDKSMGQDILLENGNLNGKYPLVREESQ